MDVHWADAYYGELYLASVAGLLGPRLSGHEAALAGRLLRLGPRDRVLDLGCGQGRHAWPLALRAGLVVGLERCQAALRLARRGGPPGSCTAQAPAPAFLRADLRALPFRDGAFDAVLSWYASLFMYDEAGNEAALRRVARLLRAGGRLLVHHANPLALALRPVEEARRELPDGGLVEERSAFDVATGVDRCTRRLARPDGSVLEATAELRLYSPAEWEALAGRAGLRLAGLTSSAPPERGAPGPDAPDLIALLEAA